MPAKWTSSGLHAIHAARKSRRRERKAKLELTKFVARFPPRWTTGVPPAVRLWRGTPRPTVPLPSSQGAPPASQKAAFCGDDQLKYLSSCNNVTSPKMFSCIQQSRLKKSTPFRDTPRGSTSPAWCPFFERPWLYEGCLRGLYPSVAFRDALPSPAAFWRLPPTSRQNKQSWYLGMNTEYLATSGQISITQLQYILIFVP